jgi:hypothetical protein
MGLGEKFKNQLVGYFAGNFKAKLAGVPNPGN